MKQSIAKSIKTFYSKFVFFGFIFHITICSALTNSSNISYDLHLEFPENFQFAAATAAYQIEGAWNISGKGESIWDRIVHTNPNFIKDKSNGDIACNSYYKFKEDVKLLSFVGFRVYRFSISWPRILPTGDPNFINQDGINYYRSLIDELTENRIQPMVTLYHWDLPQKLQDMGGWLNPKISEYFEKYALVVFKAFGEKVKWWITINEPAEVAAGYGSDLYAPALNLHGTGDYAAAHNMIKAHAKAYRIYEKLFKPQYKGRVSFALSGTFCIPKTNSEEDISAAERWNQFTFGWFGHPVYTPEGNYPPIMRNTIDRNSLIEGRNVSRLPRFTEEEVRSISGSHDFFGLNHYTSRLCTSGTEGPYPSWSRDVSVKTSVDPKWPGSASSWLKVVPEGFRGVLNWVKDQYDNPHVFVTENGFSDTGNIQDLDRVNYYQSYLNQMAKALVTDGCNLIGHTAWSLIDNFEWRSGYTEKFGVFRVNFTDPQKLRVPKYSAYFFKSILKTRRLHYRKNFSSKSFEVIKVV